MRKEEKLLGVFSEIDEKYIKEAESRMSTTKIVKVAVIFAAVIALSLYLFIPFAPVKSNLKAYEDSSYFPLIEEIDEYRLQFMQPKYKNNFEAMLSVVDDLFAGKRDDVMDLAPNTSMGNMEGLKGGYLEVTDNQVAGVIESDLFKMTTDYIFRLGYGDEGESVLRVYSVNQMNSVLLSEYEIDLKWVGKSKMYLSEDGNTVTVITDHYGHYGQGTNYVSVISLDVSNVSNIKEKARFTIEGSLNTTRMTNGKLIILTEFYFASSEIDYSDPSTFVPQIDRGKGKECIRFEDIIYPEQIGNTRYTVLGVLDANSLELLGANALLNFTNDVYISENNIFITREYNKNEDVDNGTHTSNMSDVAVINYSGERLEKKGIITLRGRAKDQYSFDEMDGYLRVVTTTYDGYSKTEGETASFRGIQNVSLYIFNLSDNSLAYKVEDFAVEGDEATAVRFMGDKLYVCTAEVIRFTDPVYFFDLTNYENITYTDTGIIEGYSTSLIDLGEGFLLGIGVENWSENKVSVYEERGESVVSVDDYIFTGTISEDYKAYMINRELNLFGFGVDYMDNGYHCYYVLLGFNGYELVEIAKIAVESNFSDTVRAVYLDGYLYLTTPASLTVRNIAQ